MVLTKNFTKKFSLADIKKNQILEGQLYFNIIGLNSVFILKLIVSTDFKLSDLRIEIRYMKKMSNQVKTFFNYAYLKHISGQLFLMKTKTSLFLMKSRQFLNFEKMKKCNF